jgi:penicillin amidase
MAPSIWILNHLESTADPSSAEGFSATGAAFVGAPGVIIGRNRNISWGVTNVGADCQDLFVIDALNYTHYRHEGTIKAFVLRNEVIKIKGKGRSGNIVYPTRETVYGPVISDLALEAINSADLTRGPPLALRWISLEDADTTFDAFMDVNLAQNWTAFQTALRSYKAPSQNMIYADSMGNIGYQMTGVLPVRPLNGTGMAPVPGNGTFDWLEHKVPFESMPRVLNPKKGYIASANNAVVPRGYRVMVTNDWDGTSDGYRAQRITELIEKASPSSPSPQLHDVSSMMHMQSDLFSGLFRDYRALVLPHLTPKTAEGVALVQAWNGTGSAAFDGVMRVGTNQGALFQRWYLQLTSLAGPITNNTYWPDSQYLLRVLSGQKRDDPLCRWADELSAANNAAPSAAAAPLAVDDDDDEAATMHSLRVGAEETCQGWSSRLVDWVASPSRSFRSDKWGTSSSNVHVAVFTHQVLSASPLACIANREVEHGGDFSTINVGGFDSSKGSFGGKMAQTHGPSYRQVIDWSSVDTASAFVHAPGQSGNVLSGHYDDMVSLWGQGAYVPMTRQEPVEAILTIQP